MTLAKVNELGPVRVTTTLTPAEPTIGDEITLEIRVEARASVDVLMPEFGEALTATRSSTSCPNRGSPTTARACHPALHAAALSVGRAVDSTDSDRVCRQSAGPETGTRRSRRVRNPDRSHRFSGASRYCRQMRRAELNPPLGELELIDRRHQGHVDGGRCLGTAGGAAAGAGRRHWSACAATSPPSTASQCLRDCPRATRPTALANADPQDERGDGSILRRHFGDHSPLSGGPVRSCGPRN